MTRILFADDEEEFRVFMAKALRLAGLDVVECGRTAEALAQLRSASFDVVLTELRMPGDSGMEIVREAVRCHPVPAILILTAFGSTETVLEALRLGVQGHLIKPLQIDVLLQKIHELLRHRQVKDASRSAGSGTGPGLSTSGLVGKSAEMAELERMIVKVGPTDATVLISGETGTGKELVARAIHRASARRDHPFVAINCSAIPKALLESQLFGHAQGSFTGADRDQQGLFATAGEGTIFLDEIGEMPLSLQPKVLRAIEAREILPLGSTVPLPVAARIIAATHRDLKAMAESGQFRQDLYYRLNAFGISIAPLRARPEDIGITAQHLVGRIAASLGRTAPILTRPAIQTLELYSWPGNVRELANVLERAMILNPGPTLDVQDLPKPLPPLAIPAYSGLRAAREAFERMVILRTLEDCGGDKQRAASALGISIASIYRKLEAWKTETREPE